ncbi:unnamed protein product [Cylicostephanus goldi]|uniref:SCP domain-containing protein n=1 Tax=Cylicostephanus goldi TaxID=71465 RepID=A0A3P7MTI8_CYLGO|nr:unnamed protein product [Cylicostephanus goldi]
MTNWRRSVLAQGQVVKRNGVYMPAAANMQSLRYDCELELKARARAEECAAEGIDGANAYYEENRHYSVKEWWKQVRLDEPIGLSCYFRAKHQSRSVRSFTRMAWANSNKIGCTIQECDDRWHSVCLYSPA